MHKLTRVLALLSVLILLTAAMASAAPKTTANGPTQKYLIAGKNDKPILKTMEKLGIEIDDNWSDDINAVSAFLTDDQVKKLKGHADLEAVETDPVRHAMGTFNDAFPITWGLDAVNAPEAWNLGYTGQGIKVCILDTGIDFNHPEFYKNGVSIVKGSKNFVTDGHATAQDGAGHGTHVAGTIAAQGSTVKGVAPNVDLYIGRVLGDDGYSTGSSVINGVKWCYQTVNADIISMSLGGAGSSVTENKTYNAAYTAGTLTIAAAGNDGTTGISYPAGYSNVVSVAAVDSNLAKADFSQYNSDVELAGPGVAVYSSLPPFVGHKDFLFEGTTSYTSSALEYSPHGKVTGQLVECGTAETTTSCVNKPAGGFIAVVSRGVISFADKANNVKAQGATAMILTNNDTANPDDFGSFTLGAAGTWPVSVSVSYNTGVAIRSGGLGTGSVEIQDFNYGYYNGTSMATPHASAVAALAWSVKPTLTNATIRSVLQTSAQDLGAAGRDVNFGYGLVMADAAVNLAKTK
ncbi:MAG TPA: S8 family serine peptidase [Symbiobacteriaceae bacterium]|nr:S8 family serine peptidase [Symbiobacteriaceae bacterium]